MKEIDGIEVAKRLRKEGCTRPILFLTAFREYVCHGYDVRAMHYLLKPVEKESLFLCLDEIAANLKGNFYLYRSKGEIIHIPYKEIVTFSGNRHYVDILTTSIGRSYLKDVLLSFTTYSTRFDRLKR